MRRRGFSVVRELCGHGIGRAIHEPPTVPNYDDPERTEILAEGAVLTIEPLIAAGRGEGRLRPDGWTVATRDGSRSAPYEHSCWCGAARRCC